MLLCVLIAEGGGDGLGDCSCDCGAMGSDVGAGAADGGGFALDGVGVVVMFPKCGHGSAYSQTIMMRNVREGR